MSISFYILAPQTCADCFLLKEELNQCGWDLDAGQEVWRRQQEHLAICEDHIPDVQMSNTNARMVIERLGLEFDYCGEVSPDDLLSRAMTGNIGRDDSGMPTHQEGRMIYVGLAPGYFEAKLGALAELATKAKELDLPVHWG